MFVELFDIGVVFALRIDSVGKVTEGCGQAGLNATRQCRGLFLGICPAQLHDLHLHTPGDLLA